MAAYMLLNFDADYDEWKAAFDSDPAGRAQVAKSYAISRAVDNPSDIYVRVEFESADEAKSFVERLLGSGVLGRFTVKNGPTVVEIAESGTY
jgi:hypothetical protein